MRPRTACGLLGCFLLAIASPIRSDDAKDGDALQGKWTYFFVTNDDKTEDIDVFAVIRGDRIQFMHADDADPKNLYGFVLDSTVTPKAIDLHKLDANGKRGEKVMEGLYEIDGDKLRCCVMPQPGPPWNRPTELKKAKGLTFMQFRRLP